MTDYPDYLTPEHHALTIYNQRVPLARNANVIASGTAKTLGGGLSVALAQQVSLDQPSWQAAFTLRLPAAAGALPFTQFEALWLLNNNQLQSWDELFYCASGNGPGQDIIVAGMGPCRGDSVSFNLANVETVQTLTYSYVVAVTSHVFARSYWRQQNLPVTAPNGFSNPAGKLATNVIATANPTITASSNDKRLIPVYLGRARIQIDNTAGTNSLGVTITDPTSVIGGGNEYFSATVAAAAAPVREEIWLPAIPILLTLTNNGTTGSIGPKVTIVASEY